MSNVIFYPKAQKLIQEMGIDERIKNNLEADFREFFRSSILQSEGKQRLHSIKKSYLDFNEELQTHAKIINDMLWYPQKYSFEFDNSRIPLEVNDISILMGWEASRILTPGEFINYKSFGIDSLPEFLGIIGFYMRNHKILREGLSWKSEFDNKTFESVVLGSHYKDPFYSQTDITQYKSIDPFGNEVSYRKVRDKDSVGFIGMEASEPHMMTLLLKYLESAYGEVEFKEISENLLEYANELFESNLPYGNLDSQSKLQDSRFFDYHFFKPMHVTSSNNKKNNIVLADTYLGENGGFLNVVKDEENNLIMGNRKDDVFLPKFYFSPEDAQQLSKSLLYHCASGQSLTSLQEVVDHINYRFSEDFVELKTYFNSLH